MFLRKVKNKYRLTAETFSDLDPPEGEPVHLSGLELKQMKEGPWDITDEIYDLVKKAYAPLGGHLDIKSPEDIPGDKDWWLVEDVDGDKNPNVVQFGKNTKFGVKFTGRGTDGKGESKAAMWKTQVGLLNKPGYYAEVSDAPAHILLTKHKVPYLKTKEEVEKVLGKPVTWIGEIEKYKGVDGWYERNIAGKTIRKILVGTPA